MGDKVVLAIVGNKIDLDKERNVPAEEATEYTKRSIATFPLKLIWFKFMIRYSKSVGATHFLTSAKTNRGIEELFLDVTQQLLRMAESQNQLNSSPSLTHNRNPEVVIVDDNPAPKKSCCG